MYLNPQIHDTQKIHSRYVSDTSGYTSRYVSRSLRVAAIGCALGLLGLLALGLLGLLSCLGRCRCCCHSSLAFLLLLGCRCRCWLFAFSSLGSRANRTSPGYVSWTYLHCISNISCVYPAYIQRGSDEASKIHVSLCISNVSWSVIMTHPRYMYRDFGSWCILMLSVTKSPRYMYPDVSWCILLCIQCDT